MFFIVFSGVSLGTFGRVYIILMFVFPLLGFILGLKVKKGLLKWLLIILNIISICVIGYILLLGYAIAEG